MAQRAADQITLTDLTDGVAVILSNDSHTFPGSVSAALAGSTTVKITALMGADVVPASVNTSAVTKPAGVTVVSDNHATSPTLTISVSTAVTTGGEVEIPVSVGDLTIVKKFTYAIAYKGTTGSPGSNGVSTTLVGLKNEAHTIVTNSAGSTVGSSTIQVNFYGYVGATRSPVTAAVGTLPSGMTVGTNTAGTASADGILTLSVAASSTLGGSDSGVVPITLTCNGISRAINFSWAKAKAGAAGSNGSNGAPAITLEISSSAGLVFKNTQVATVLTANVYQGGVQVTGAALTALGTVKWYKDGSSTATATGTTLTIAAGDVADRATYEARLEN